MGNKTYINARPFRIILPKSIFFANEPITGEIWIEPEMTMILYDVIVSIKIDEGWYYSNDENSSDSENNTQILSNFCLNNGTIFGVSPSQVKHLSPGKYIFPFSFPVINQLQPTFEYYSDHLRYTIAAESVALIEHMKAEVPIIIKSIPCNLLTPLSLSCVKTVRTWGMFNRGATEIKVSFPRNNYKVGDVVQLTVNVDNTRGERNITKLKINLKRVLHYKRNNFQKYTSKWKIYQEKIDFLVNRRQTRQETINFPLYYKTETPSIYNNDQNVNAISHNFMPSLESLLLSCKYYIKVSCYFESFVPDKSRPSVRMPIAITHQVMSDLEVPNEDNNITFETFNDFAIINNSANNSNVEAPPIQNSYPINSSEMYDKI